MSAVRAKLRCEAAPLAEPSAVVALLDTGSSVNLVRIAYIDKIPASVEHEHGHPSLRLADGEQKIEPLDGVSLSVDTMESRASIWCWVVPTLAFDLIIGTPGLVQLGVKIHFNKNTVNRVLLSDRDDPECKMHHYADDHTYEYTGKDALLSCGVSSDPNLDLDHNTECQSVFTWSDPLPLGIRSEDTNQSWYEIEDFP